MQSACSFLYQHPTAPGQSTENLECGGGLFSLRRGQMKHRIHLFNRISEVTIRVPPLRDRQGGKLLLAQFLLQQISESFGKPTRGLAPDVVRGIQAHRWPGNVRELESRIKG